MKRSLKYCGCTIAAIGLYSSQLFAQGLINNGAYIANNGAYIYIAGGAAMGNFTNQDAGASIGLVNNTGFMEVTGNWTNNSTQNIFTANTGTVELIGTAQLIGGTQTTWFNNLNCLGGGNKTLNFAELVGGGYAAPAGVLALNDRFLLLNTKKLTVTNPLTTAIIRTTGYIVSEHNVGNNLAIIQWNVGAINGVYVFPFGTTAVPANYIPLTITKTAGNTNILASTRHTSLSDNQPWQISVTQMWSQTIPGAGQVPVVIDRWWDIKSAPAFTGAVSFTYLGVENTTSYAPAGTFSAQNWVGTSWNPPVGAGPGVVAGTAVVSIPAQALGGTTPWVLSNTTAPLPIKLLYFDAKMNNKIVQLDWSTATETNNAFFEVQRSTDNQSFETIDVVDGAGNSTVVRDYNDVDKKPFTGVSYYRLRQVDYDGKFSFSQTVPVRLDNQKSFDFVFASPAESSSTVTLGFFNTVSEPISVLVTDSYGKKIFSSEFSPVEGFNKKEIQLPQLASAIYFVTLANSTNTITKIFFIN